ncbi:cobalamin B12-binding domain-containing protein [Halodesulfurarchaeum formicicum]|uniref:B12 binding domain/Pterin binding enzyme n=1 Tax=Halodesulfurarchaeum formicicum TaxID=1873524 RepID=A0A1J1AEI9_9EURY|nr:cobalamin-dependent protein [Halodesulfurarchaeum formicicum]APE96219.1 B12 binding domain/Pterin binding enzyme [Halodesulfurarchaeum formicicum]
MSEEFVQALADLEEERAIEMANDRLDAGEDPMDVLDDLKKGMAIVGDRYDAEEYFIPDLMYAGDIIDQISDLLVDEMDADESETLGTIVLGTVKDDIHDIGKDLVFFMFDLNGFEVIDLGVDVPIENFVEAVEENDPDIIALSGFLTAAFDSMKETVEALEEAGLVEEFDEDGLRDGTKIMIGGGQITDDVRNYVRADGYETDAPSGVRLAKEWLGEA